MAQVPIKLTFSKQCETLERVLGEARERNPYSIGIWMERDEGEYPTVIVAETPMRDGGIDRKTRIRISGETERA